MSHLGSLDVKANATLVEGLNPCCNGCRTWANMKNMEKYIKALVLILVVMDVALGQVFSQTLRNQ